MEYLAIAYMLIAIVLLGYALSLWRRMQTTQHERALIETKQDD